MIRIAMIGGGPKCLFALLELNDLLAGDGAGLVQVDVYDPYPPGAGRVWNAGQPRELRLNVNSRIIDASSSLCAQTFNDYRARQAPESSHDAFPPRALVGEYLSEQFRLLARQGTLAVTHRALAVEQLERHGEQWRVATSTGSGIYDEVVLTTGHGLAGTGREAQHGMIPAGQLTVEQSAQAMRKVPAGAEVQIRGAALTAYDVAMVLTEGRGGRWEPMAGGSPDALKYLPSGDEPRLITMTSRHGIPMTPKPQGIDSTAQRILDSYKLQLRQWGSSGTGEIRQMWRILLDCAIDIADATQIAASEESLARTVRKGRSDQFSTQSNPFEQIRYSLDAHHGRNPHSQEWVWAVVWSGLYSELVVALARFQWDPQDRKEFNAAAVNLERMAFGPPAPTAQKLLALHEAGMLRHERAGQGEAGETIRIDAVTAPAGVLSDPCPQGEPASELIRGLLLSGQIKIRPGERGLLTDTDGTCITAEGSRNESLAALGRPTEDPTLGHDTLNRALHPEYRGWSQRIIAQVNARNRKVAY